MRNRLAFFVLVAALGALASGCGGSGGGASSTKAASGSDACAKASLPLVNAGKLTVGTDNPAYPPWFGGGEKAGSPWKINDPSTGEGFESAVAYAVAKQLGFSHSEVQWVVVPFDQSFKPGPKAFDFDINQISYTPERAQSVSFSDSYYDVNQAVVALKSSSIANASSVADLRSAKLGAPIGTTSYQYIVNNVKPSQKPGVYNTLNDALNALKAKQIDGVVVDLPTAFYVTAAQVPGSKIVGQFPAVGQQEHFGMVFEKGSKLVPCVNKALSKLRADGELKALQQKWLADKASAPVLG